MAKWFRSEPMEYISIIMNEDASHDCLADLGKLGAIQFTDVSIQCVFFSLSDAVATRSDSYQRVF
jgi:vacuolar-type H+-ATPase subunit I/STV1